MKKLLVLFFIACNNSPKEISNSESLEKTVTSVPSEPPPEKKVEPFDPLKGNINFIKYITG